MQKKNNANDPDYVSSIFPHQNYGKASQSPHRRCVSTQKMCIKLSQTSERKAR